MSKNIPVIEIGEIYTKVTQCSLKDKINIEKLATKKTINEYFFSDSSTSIDAQSKLITQILSEIKFNRKDVGVILPASKTYSQVLEMPLLKEKELISAVKYQADQIIPIPIEELVFDVKVIEEDRVNKKLNILVVAARQSLIDKITFTIEESGFAINFVENQVSAVARFVDFLAKLKAVTSNVVVLNIGYSGSSMFLFDLSRSCINYIDHFNTGLDLFIKELNLNLNIDKVQAISLFEKGEVLNNKRYSTILLPSLKEFLKDIDDYLNKLKANGFDDISNMLIFGDSANFPEIIPLVEKYTGMIVLKQENLTTALNIKKPAGVSTVFPYLAPISGVLR